MAVRSPQLAGAVPPGQTASQRLISGPARRLILIVATAAAVAAFALIAAGGASAATPPPSTLTIDQANSPATLDPGMQYDNDSFWVYRNIFDQLLRANPTTQKPQPWVAKSWKRVTPTKWVFNIRSGIKFTNGEPLTGKDVAFSIERILDPKNASAQAENFSAISKATGTNSTVTITTKAPSPTLLNYLTTLSIVPEAYVKKVGNKTFALHPIGSGPYELTSWVQDSSVNLAANPNYWNGKPAYKQVVFRTVPDDATRVADLESGSADISLELSPDDVTSLQGRSGVKVITNPTQAVAYLGLNVLGKTPTQSLQVRQAIAYAINYPSIIKNVLDGFGKPVKEVLTPLSFGYDPSISGFTYNLAKAKKLLKASGDPHPTITFPTDPAYPTQVIQAIQANLEAAGMKVNIVNSSAATYLSKVQGPTHNWGSVRYGTWTCGCSDADGTVEPLFHTGSIWASYSNPSLDKVMDAARTTLNSAKRKKDYAKAFQILQDTVPGIGLWQVYEISGVNSNISWTPGSAESLFINDIKWN
jgi:peptide/nickel transport system substrate-binding protein